MEKFTGPKGNWWVPKYKFDRQCERDRDKIKRLIKECKGKKEENSTNEKKNKEKRIKMNDIKKYNNKQTKKENQKEKAKNPKKEVKMGRVLISKKWLKVKNTDGLEGWIYEELAWPNIKS